MYHTVFDVYHNVLKSYLQKHTKIFSFCFISFLLIFVWSRDFTEHVYVFNTDHAAWLLFASPGDWYHRPKPCRTSSSVHSPVPAPAAVPAQGQHRVHWGTAQHRHQTGNYSWSYKSYTTKYLYYYFFYYYYKRKLDLYIYILLFFIYFSFVLIIIIDFFCFCLIVE